MRQGGVDFTRAIRRWPLPAAWMVVLALAPVAAQALTLTGVQSRKTHGAGVGARDVMVDLTQALPDKVSVEPRGKGNAHTLVFQFDAPITSAGTLTAIDDTLSPLAGATAVPDGNTVVVTLPAVNDNARAIVTLSEVNGTGGFTASAALGFKVGDVDGNGAISSVDISRIKSRAGQGASSVTDVSQPRHDFNASGAITAADVAAAKARPSQVQLASGNAPNAAPVVSVVDPGTLAARRASFISGSASDDGLPFGALFITWSTVSGPALAQFGDRTRLTTPVVLPVVGAYTLRLTANDGQRASTMDVNVNAAPANVLEIAPTSFQFAPVTVGQSAAVEFQLLNVGATVQLNLNFAIGGTNAGEFAVTAASGNACGSTLSAGAHCTMAVTFSPTSAGNKSAALDVSTVTGGAAGMLLQAVGQ